MWWLWTAELEAVELARWQSLDCQGSMSVILSWGPHFLRAWFCILVRRIFQQACSYHCGARVTDRAPEWDVGRATVRWARDPLNVDEANGRGEECWACHRVWAVHVCHTWKDRDCEDYKHSCGSDMEVLKKHTALKEKVEAKAQNKLKRSSEASVFRM